MTLSDPKQPPAPYRHWRRRLLRRFPNLNQPSLVSAAIAGMVLTAYHGYLFLWLRNGGHPTPVTDVYRLMFFMGATPVFLGAIVPMLLGRAGSQTYLTLSARRNGLPPPDRFGALVWMVSWFSIAWGRPDVAIAAALVGQLERGFRGISERCPRGWRRALADIPWKAAYLAGSIAWYPWLLLASWVVNVWDRPTLRERVRTVLDREAFLQELDGEPNSTIRTLHRARRRFSAGDYRGAQSVLLEATPSARQALAQSLELDLWVSLDEGRSEEVVRRLSDLETLSPAQRACLAHAHLQEGRPEAALQTVRDGDESRDLRLREVAALALYQLGDLDAALQELEVPIPFDYEAGPRIAATMGRWLMEHGDAQEALPCFRRAILRADYLEPQHVCGVIECLRLRQRQREADILEAELTARLQDLPERS